MGFGSDFTDNPASPGSGGEWIATFLLGIPDTGEINGLNNIIYNRQIYAVYGLDDFRVTPRLTLNLGLRYELFTTIKEANNLEGTFDFNSLSLIVPHGINTQLTPMLASELTIQRNSYVWTHQPRPEQFCAPHWIFLSARQQARSAWRLTHYFIGEHKTANSPTRAPGSILRFLPRRCGPRPAPHQSQIRHRG